jgi:chemotaxis response regulator CheB
MPHIDPIRVLVADDSPTALRSVCDYLDFAGGLEVVCTASDGVNAVQLVAKHQPDLALLDFRMPRLNGL